MTTKTMTLKLASPTKDDFSTMWAFFHHGQHLEDPLKYAEIEFTGWSDQERRHFNAMAMHQERNPNAFSRVLMAAETMLNPENGLIDQNADVLQLSERVAMALTLLELVEGESPKAFDYLKGSLIGEQEISVTTTCTACDFDFPDEDCEVCGGEVEYQQEYPITWTDQKDTLSLAFSELLRVARGKISE